MAAHVLRVVSSPVYSGRTQIVSLQQAVARLGVSKIREIALTGQRAYPESAGVRYELIVGDAVDPLYREWLGWLLPQVVVTVLPRSGHFPHLAHPRRFAEHLAAFGGSIAPT